MSMSIPERMEKARQIRQMSGEATQLKSADIMDVNQEAVENMMLRHGVQQLIHGHTHRPGTHEFILNKKPAQRHVLPDWSNAGSFALAVCPQTGSSRLVAV
jgi:UDP-2,3-diacylglucosamine hydrolase